MAHYFKIECTYIYGIQCKRTPYILSYIDRLYTVWDIYVAVMGGGGLHIIRNIAPLTTVVRVSSVVGDIYIKTWCLYRQNEPL